jgi:hypothetical protein
MGWPAAAAWLATLAARAVGSQTRNGLQTGDCMYVGSDVVIVSSLAIRGVVTDRWRRSFFGLRSAAHVLLRRSGH